MNPMNLSFILNTQTNPPPQPHPAPTSNTPGGSITFNVKFILNNIQAYPNNLPIPLNPPPQEISRPRFMNIYQTQNNNTRATEPTLQSSINHSATAKMHDIDQKQNREENRISANENIQSGQEHVNSKSKKTNSNSRISPKPHTHHLSHPSRTMTQKNTKPSINIIDETEYTIEKEGIRKEQQISNGADKIKILDCTAYTKSRYNSNKRKLDKFAPEETPTTHKKPKLTKNNDSNEGFIPLTIEDRVKTIAGFVLCKSCETKKDQIDPLCKSCNYRLMKESADSARIAQNQAAKILSELT